MKKLLLGLTILIGLSLQADFSLTSKIYVAGHNGLVGRAIMKELESQGYCNIITRSSRELDLRNQQSVNDFFAQEKPKFVFLAAAKVGGIKANWDFQADAIYDNLMIQCNILHASYVHKVEKLLFLGSSCIYPRDCPQPIKEEYLLSGPLEETNKSYAVAKISGLQMCQAYNYQYGTNFISCMPTNLYGPHDNFNLQTSHVLPALLAKFVKAKQENLPIVPVWGTGAAYREFLYVDDLAQACLFLMKNYNKSETVNVGTGVDLTIADLAQTIKDTVGYAGEIIWDITKSDGTPKKQLDVSVMAQMGWQAKTTLAQGLEKTLAWFHANGGLRLIQGRNG